MKDRHLYKAKCIGNGKWVQGTLIHKSSSFAIECDEYYIFDGIETGSSDVFHAVHPSTICQCTGLKDKNGKLIWENDIVTVPGDEEPCLIGWDEDCAKWSMTQCGSNMYDFDNYWSGELEVIGSAIDNPELLEVEE